MSHNIYTITNFKILYFVSENVITYNLNYNMIHYLVFVNNLIK